MTERPVREDADAAEQMFVSDVKLMGQLKFSRALCVAVGLADMAVTAFIVYRADTWFIFLVALIPLVLGIFSFEQARKLHHDIEQQRQLYPRSGRNLYRQYRRLRVRDRARNIPRHLERDGRD